MRYAIYFTPAPDTDLWRFGYSVLGCDAAAQETVPFPEHDFWHEPWFVHAQTAPARYGFHATLKAPFELALGATEALLLDRAAAFGAGRMPIYLPALEVALLDDFVALRPLAEDAELNRLAAACVRRFADLRAPLTAADRTRRLLQPLTPRQITHLERWGYPYVLEDFRFHMTLTGPIPTPMQTLVLTTIAALYRPISKPLIIDTFSVLLQPTRESPFRLLARFPLSGTVPVLAFDR